MPGSGGDYVNLLRVDVYCCRRNDGTPSSCFLNVGLIEMMDVKYYVKQTLLKRIIKL